MEAIVRSKAPDWLAEKWQVWGQEWQQKQKLGKKFAWRVHNKQSYQQLVIGLSELTKAHCSFCDVSGIGPRIKPTIEHFKPKAKFPLVAYQWENLFICCANCQTKGDSYDDNLIKPDEPDYCFDDYYIFDFSNGMLKPNPASSEQNQHKALITIELYRLNQNGKPEDRLKELEWFMNLEHVSLDDLDHFAYRFALRSFIDFNSSNST